MAGRGTALTVRDGTGLNLPAHPERDGPGTVGKSGKASSGAPGLHMRPAPAVGTGGVPRTGFDAPDGKADRSRPEEERKPARRPPGLRGMPETAPPPAGVRTVRLTDREADFLRLSGERERLGSVGVPVRAKAGRSLGEGLPKPFGSVREPPVRGRAETGAGPLPARRAAAGRKARTAEAELRRDVFDLPPPAERKGCRDRAPVRLTAAHVRETEEPAGGSGRLERLPLASLQVRDGADAERIPERHALGRRIGDWYGILRSGCRAERLKPRSAERIGRAAAVRAAVAWRLAAMVMTGRETPELPAGVPFSGIGTMAPAGFAADRRLPPPDGLGRASVPMAVPGGCLGRSGGPPPGRTVIRRGCAGLAAMAGTCGRPVRMEGTGLPCRKLRPDRNCVS